MTQLEFKLANSNSGSCRTTQSTILVVFSDGRMHLSWRFSSAVCWWWSHTAHARM